MSGIYLILWDKTHRENSPVLGPGTCGGWPHLTLVYTGKHVDRNTLLNRASMALVIWHGETFNLTRAYVNSWTGDDGKEWHDVLLETAQTEAIERTRTTLLRGQFPDEHLIMRPPHVTRARFANKQDAESAAQALNEEHLPHEVVVAGVALN